MFYIYDQAGGDKDPLGRECRAVPFIPSYETVERLAQGTRIEGFALVVTVALPTEYIDAYPMDRDGVLEAFASYDGNVLWVEVLLIDGEQPVVATDDTVLGAYTRTICLMRAIARGMVPS